MLEVGQQSQAELERFAKDIEYCEERYQELLDRYPEQWIAILNQEIVGDGSNFDLMLADMNARGIPVWQTLTRFMTTEDTVLTLGIFP